jgi:hypothetical protein
MRETPLCTGRHMTRDEDQNHTSQVLRAQHVLECYGAAVPIETLHSDDGHRKFVLGLLLGVTVGTNMKTDLREPARRHGIVHAEVFTATLRYASLGATLRYASPGMGTVPLGAMIAVRFAVRLLPDHPI